MVRFKHNLRGSTGQMRYFIFFIVSYSSLVFSQDLSEKKILEYYQHIALKQEFKDSKERVKKWTGNINIYCEGKWNTELHKELQLIIKDLSALIGKVKINVVKSKTKANYTIFIGSPEDYVKNIEPKAEERVARNFGLFFIYWDQNKRIFKGSMYIDPERAHTLTWQKHLLREELTQSLGLMNDSLEYKNSIFFEKYSQTTSFSELDKILIKLHYSKFIRPNMSKIDVLRIIELQDLISKTKKEIK